jgi:two-component system cell cycle response regulator
LVIADWELPDISGPELCRIVRSKFASAYSYVMLLTSNSDKKSIAEGLAGGADDYLTKPFDSEELRARVGVGRRVIEMHRDIEAKTKALAREARIWVVLADLDSHKPAADLFGHAAGDCMLQEFGEILKKNTRVSDMCGHLGGDQFILVVTHVSTENIQLVVNRLREKLANHEFTFQGAALPLFATFGVAGSEGGERLELSTLLQKADAALLDAKRCAQTSVSEATVKR